MTATAHADLGDLGLPDYGALPSVERFEFEPRRRLARDVERDLAMLRQLMLDRHDIHLPIDDPLCTEFTAFSAVVSRLLAGAREERELAADELRSLIHGTDAQLEQVIARASQPLARAMKDTFDPQAVAKQVTAELYDDLRRECRQAVREARRAFVVIALCVLSVGSGLAYYGSYQLAEARALLHMDRVFGGDDVAPR